MGLREYLCRRREARVDQVKAMDDTKAVIAESEAVKQQLRRLTQELADYVGDLRALTITLAVRRKNEGTIP